MLRERSSTMNSNIQLLVLPHAVGSLGSYIKFKKIKNLNLINYELPGRGTRFGESIKDMSQITNEAIEYIDFSREYILFGHSMGALIAYEICCAIEEGNFPKPIKIILSGQNPPVFNEELNDFKMFTIDESINYFGEMGGTSKEVLNNTEMMDIYTDILNKDLLFLNQYLKKFQFKKIETDLEIWFGKEDESLSTKNRSNWKNFTNGKCDFLQFEGGHFYINELLLDTPKLSNLLGVVS